MAPDTMPSMRTVPSKVKVPLNSNPRARKVNVSSGHCELFVLAGRSEHAVQKPASGAAHPRDAGQLLLLGRLARPVQGPDLSPPFRIAHPVQADPFLDGEQGGLDGARHDPGG